MCTHKKDNLVNMISHHRKTDLQEIPVIFHLVKQVEMIYYVSKESSFKVKC